MNRNRQEKGITLIALVITIIVLLILAGVSLRLIAGGEGIIGKAEKASQKHMIAQAKEELELAIAELSMNEYAEGKTLIKESLIKLNEYGMSVESTDSFPVEAINGDYKFQINDKYEVTYIGQATGTIIKYTTNPDGYTNQDSITIKLEIKNIYGIKEIQCPDGTTKQLSNVTETTIDFPITQNGTYTFKIIDSKGNETNKDIIINKIDKLPPKDFIIVAEQNKNKILITANAEDAEETDENSKSGIEKYEYKITAPNGVETVYDTNEIEIQAEGTYTIKVIAYDKAGNSKEAITSLFAIEASSYCVFDANNQEWEGSHRNPNYVNGGSFKIQDNIMSFGNNSGGSFSCVSKNKITIPENCNTLKMLIKIEGSASLRVGYSLNKLPNSSCVNVYASNSYHLSDFTILTIDISKHKQNPAYWYIGDDNCYARPYIKKIWFAE